MARIIQKNRYERRRALKNIETRINKIINYFYNTATSIFSYEIEGLTPYLNSLASRELEHRLFNEGWATVFIDPRDNIIKVGGVAGRGKIGQYRQFVEWTAIMGDGTNVHGLNTSNAVIIYNNKSRTATRVMIEDDIRNMVDTDISISQHTKATRIPFVFSGNEDDMLTFKSMYESVLDGEGAFFLDREGQAGISEPFKVWNSDVEYKGDKLIMLYEAYENRVFSMLGIQSNRIDKKAQIGESEVDKNDDVILVNFEAFKSERQYACDIAKEVGINIKLKINEYLVKQNGEQNGENVAKQEDKEDKETIQKE
jgi:hypothetical protein